MSNNETVFIDSEIGNSIAVAGENLNDPYIGEERNYENATSAVVLPPHQLEAPEKPDRYVQKILVPPQTNNVFTEVLTQGIDTPESQQYMLNTIASKQNTFTFIKHSHKGFDTAKGKLSRLSHDTKNDDIENIITTELNIE